VIGFLVILVLFVVSLLLFRSMTKHIRKVPKSFDPPAPGGEEPPSPR
jgi:hypothetical protein